MALRTRGVAPTRPTPDDVYGDRLLVPGLRHLGCYRWGKARPDTLGPHRHPRVWEICLVMRGQVEWWADDGVFRVGAGQCYVTRPGEVHGGVDSVMHACELYWLSVRLPLRAMQIGRASCRERVSKQV